jgi:hypothetical protein
MVTLCPSPSFLMILHCHTSTKQDSTLYTQYQFRDGSNTTLELLCGESIQEEALLDIQTGEGTRRSGIGTK